MSSFKSKIGKVEQKAIDCQSGTLKKCTVVALKEMLRKAGLKIGGRKDVLISRLQDHMSSVNTSIKLDFKQSNSKYRLIANRKCINEMREQKKKHTAEMREQKEKHTAEMSLLRYQLRNCKSGNTRRKDDEPTLSFSDLDTRRKDDEPILPFSDLDTRRKSSDDSDFDHEEFSLSDLEPQSLDGDGQAEYSDTFGELDADAPTTDDVKSNDILGLDHIFEDDIVDDLDETGVDLILGKELTEDETSDLGDITGVDTREVDTRDDTANFIYTDEEEEVDIRDKFSNEAAGFVYTEEVKDVDTEVDMKEPENKSGVHKMSRVQHKAERARIQKAAAQKNDEQTLVDRPEVVKNQKIVDTKALDTRDIDLYRADKRKLYEEARNQQSADQKARDAKLQYNVKTILNKHPKYRYRHALKRLPKDMKKIFIFVHDNINSNIRLTLIKGVVTAVNPVSYIQHLYFVVKLNNDQKAMLERKLSTMTSDDKYYFNKDLVEYLRLCKLTNLTKIENNTINRLVKSRVDKNFLRNASKVLPNVWNGMVREFTKHKSMIRFKNDVDRFEKISTFLRLRPDDKEEKKEEDEKKEEGEGEEAPLHDEETEKKAPLHDEETEEEAPLNDEETETEEEEDGEPIHGYKYGYKYGKPIHGYKYGGRYEPQYITEGMYEDGEGEGEYNSQYVAERPYVDGEPYQKARINKRRQSSLHVYSPF